jgi:CDP-diacylglycerol---glycerol-3-phosphate 3-phosphatidyltransferase
VNIANILTMSRIVMVPIIAVFLVYESFWASITATVIFSLGTFTDFLDGYLARNYNMESNLGKLLDPLADKLMVCTVLIFLIPLERAPAWIVAVIIGREIAVTGVRAIASEQNVIIAASWLGKYKTAFQCTAIIGLLIHYTILGIDFQKCGEFFLIIACFFTIWSGWDYIYNHIKAVS